MADSDHLGWSVPCHGAYRDGRWMADDVITFWQPLPCFSQWLDTAECQSTTKKFIREAYLDKMETEQWDYIY